MTFHPATLRAARMLSPKVRELTFAPPPGFAFVAGQWVSLRVPDPLGGDTLARSYSIASPPRADGSFDLAVTLVPGGPVSALLHAMPPGETVTITHAQGFFTLPFALPRPLLFVATGTGLAPLRAMLYDALARPEAPEITLLFGVQTERDVLYGDELRALASTHPNFRFHPTLSRPSPEWRGRTGYVQTHLAELVPTLPGCEVYACGLNAMIREVRKTLKETLGFTRERIHSERYD